MNNTRARAYSQDEAIKILNEHGIQVIYKPREIIKMYAFNDINGMTEYEEETDIFEALDKLQRRTYAPDVFQDNK